MPITWRRGHVHAVVRTSFAVPRPAAARAGRPAHAQDVTEVTLKGAFLFNFARFTEWPADALPAGIAVSACVLGDRAVGDAFSRTVKGKQLRGRAIVMVTIIAPNSPLPMCHLLYLSGVADAAIGEIVSAVARDVRS